MGHLGEGKRAFENTILHMGLGWGLAEPATVPYVPQGRVCFWGGWGGSMVINDADRRTTLAYMMNRMAPGIIGGENIARLAACLNEILARDAGVR